MGLARLIHQHAPLLEELSVGRDDLASAVEQAYEELKTASEQHGDGIEIMMSDWWETSEFLRSQKAACYGVVEFGDKVIHIPSPRLLFVLP
jgi:hypothetical protein